MNNLLKVMGRRLLRDKVFYLAITVTLVLSLYVSLSNAPLMAEWAKAGEDVSLEKCFFNLAPLLGLIFASFTSLFLGTEYSDGALRNKLIAGHGRISVFLADFIITMIGCLVINTAWVAGSLPGLCFFDGFAFGWKTFALWIAVSLCSAAAFAAIFTTLSMLISNKAVSAVVSLVLWFVLLFIGSIILNELAIPETVIDFTALDGGYATGEPYPNPNYLTGTKRTIFETLSHILPVCPMSSMSNDEFENPVLDIVWQLAVTVVVLTAGCIGFRKKDLK